MKTTLLAIAILAVLLSSVMAQSPADLKSLQGSWEMEELILGSIAQHSPAGFSVGIEGDRLTYHYVINSKPGSAEMSIKINSAKSPPTIDAVLLNGTFQGRVCRGIYTLDGDQLSICLADDPALPRPTRFEAKEGARINCFVLRRSKP